MGKYLLGKLGRAVLTIIAVVTFAFLTLHAAGDPAVVMLSPDTPPEVLDAFRREWGLDQPLWQQYLTYWGNILHGNFGESMRSDRPALELIMDRLPATLTLMLPALVFKIGLGIPLGILAALNRNTWIDRVTIAGAVFSHAVPNFVMGFLLVILELVYSATDPPIKALRKVIPPLRIGSVSLDLSFVIVLIIAYMLLFVVDGFR